MATFIHAKWNKRDGRLLFREWSTITDTYLTAPMTGPEMARYLFLHGARGDEPERRVARAARHGTSSLIPGDRRNAHGPWDRQRR